jgi:hypothetical protein
MNLRYVCTYGDDNVNVFTYVYVFSSGDVCMFVILLMCMYVVLFT